MTNYSSNEIDEQINGTIEDIHGGHLRYVSGFARLGYLLNEVRLNKYWKNWGYESFGKYIKTIEERIKHSRSQIYNAISVADKLLPYMDVAKIEQIGIGKATELSKLVKFTGIAPPQELIESAADPSLRVESFKALVWETTVLRPVEEKGRYLDLKGFYATDEEHEEVEYVFDLATKVDPVIPKEATEWTRRKEVVFRLVREFRATYEAQVYGNQNLAEGSANSGAEAS